MKSSIFWPSIFPGRNIAFSVKGLGNYLAQDIGMLNSNQKP
jgi:hypothetical protein